MDYNSIYIDENQCNEIAYNIYLDISDYIKNNKDEFNHWLNQKEEYDERSPKSTHQFG